MARVIIAVLKTVLSLMKVSTAYLGKTKKPERDDRKSIRAEKRVPSHND